MTRTQLTRNLKIIFLALSLLISRGLSMAAPAPRVVLFLGDSITAGYGLDPSQDFPELMQQKIDASRWNFELGANDGLRGLPVENSKKNLQAIIDHTKDKYPEAKVIVAGMKVPPNMGGDYGRKFEAVFVDLAKNNNAPLIPFILEGVGGLPELNLADGIHPTAKGHEIVAANVWKVLEPVLRSLAGKSR
jgi:acyl-CoA thioesterase-1